MLGSLMTLRTFIVALALVMVGCSSNGGGAPPDADPPATGGTGAGGAGGKGGTGGTVPTGGTAGKADSGTSGGAGGGGGSATGGTVAGGGGAGGAGGSTGDGGPRDMATGGAAGNDAAPEVVPTDALPNHGEAAAAFFKLSTIHQLEITVDAAVWQAFLKEHADTKVDPVWHQADMKLDGVALSKVGFKTFGFGSRIFGPTKPNLNLDINKYVPGQYFQGLSRLRFKNNSQDPSAMRQALVYESMRAAGLAAPRASFAHVTVNGVDYGFYSSEEPFTSTFVLERTGNDNGPAYEAFDCRGFVAPATGCARLLDDYSRPFNPTTGVGEDLAALCTVMNGPAEQFVAGLSPLIDLNEWILAVAADTALAGDYDGFSTNANNYRLYHDTAANKMRLYLFGPDVSFDSDYLPLPDPLKPAPGADCGMRNPTYRDIFLEKLLATPAGLDLYKAAVKKLRTGVMSPATLKARVDTIWALIGAQVKADPRPPTEGLPPETSKEHIKLYIDARNTALIAAGL
jgi:hypothetical protein